MVHLDMFSYEDGNSISITYLSIPDMDWRVSYQSVSCRPTIVNVDAMNYDVSDILHGDTRTVITKVDALASAIDCLETVHDELFLELDDHVSLEDDTEGLYLNHDMT